MSLSLSFNEIPQNGWALPGNPVEVRPSYSNTALVAYPTKIVIFGVKLPGAPGAVNVPFQVTRLADVTARAGAGSIAEDMAADFIAGNPINELWMVLVPEASGASAATGSLAYSGSPSAAGTVAEYIAGRRLAVNISTSDTATTIASAVAAAINAIPNMPVTATSSSGTVTLTAKHNTDTTNDITLLANLGQYEQTPAGITRTPTAMSGGAGAVSLSAAIAACATTWFAYMVLPCSDSTNMGLITTELARRYNALGHLDSLAFGATLGTLSANESWCQGQNSQFLSVLPAPVTSTITTVEPRWRLAAIYAAQASYYLSQDPSRQLKGLPLVGMRVPVGGDYLDTERNLLLLAGGTTFTASNGVCLLERAVTTNTTDANGVPSVAWQDIMAPAVASRIRFDYRSYKALNYPRAKLAPDGSPAADSADVVITVPNGLLGIWATRAKIYEQQGWIVNLAQTLPLCQAGFPSDGTRNRAVQKLVYQRIDNDIQTNTILEFQV